MSTLPETELDRFKAFSNFKLIPESSREPALLDLPRLGFSMITFSLTDFGCPNSDECDEEEDEGF